MNKQHLLAAVIFAMTTIAAGNANAQKVKNVSFNSETDPVKNTLADLRSDDVVNAKVAKHFKKEHPQAMQESWYTFKDGYAARFNEGGALQMEGYSRKGNWQYTIVYTDEKKLPANIRSLVKSVYYDYEITFVEEITVHAQKIYLVYVQDSTTWKVLRVTDDEMVIMDDFNKSN